MGVFNMTEATACFRGKGQDPVEWPKKKTERIAGAVPLGRQEVMGLVYDCLVLGTWTLPFILEI